MKSSHVGYGSAVALLAVSAAAIGGLLWWAHDRALQGFAKDDPTGPPPEKIGPFPTLVVGTAILVDTAAAALPPPFSAVPQAPGVVDLVMRDPLVVSATFGIPGQRLPLGFSGTIPRSSIVKVLSPPPPGATI